MWRIEDKPNTVGLTERHELQRQGIEEAKADGKHLGRPRVEYPENWEDCYGRWKSGVISQDDQQESDSGILSGIQTFGSKGNCYYTIRMDDDMLVERLERSGAEFKQIKESENCLLSMAISVLFSFGLAPVNRSLAALICAAEYSRAVHPQPHPYS